MLGWIFFALAVLVGLFYLASGDGVATGPGTTAHIAIVGVVLGVYAFWLLGGQRGRMGQALYYLAVWAGIGLVMIAGYSYRHELGSVASRITGELLPPGEVVSVDPGADGSVSVQIRGRGDGHFIARAKVNGASTLMLVDTGASAVVLSPEDAKRAGVDLDGLSFTARVSTANGTAYAAPIRLRSVSVGAITVRDVEALVARPGGLEQSLLGMSFLRRLGSYEVTKQGQYLTLRR